MVTHSIIPDCTVRRVTKGQTRLNDFHILLEGNSIVSVPQITKMSPFGSVSLIFQSLIPVKCK